jgi:hypothetical protein
MQATGEFGVLTLPESSGDAIPPPRGYHISTVKYR